MENQNKNLETGKYGNLTFGEVSKFLIDIIGQNVILDLMPEKEQENYARNIQRTLYKDNKKDYGKFATTEPESPQDYFALFFEKVLEVEYDLPHTAMIIIDSFTWQFFHAITCFSSFEKPKEETVLFLLRKQLFNFIYHNLIRGYPLDNSNSLKIPADSIIKFLMDSYKKIFEEIESSYKNKETFYSEINNYCEENSKKYPKLLKKEVVNYKRNVVNWCNVNFDKNANWEVLVPVLDFLNQDKKNIVHRLIGLYLLKNAQRAMQKILDISETEQDKMIIDIITMLRENKRPENFYNDNDFVFPEQVNLISMYLAYQHQEDFNVEKSNEIIKAIEEKCLQSKIFFSTWLKTRVMVFEKGETLKEDNKTQEQIINGYKTAYNEGINYAGGYLGQFLLEAIVINRFFNPRRVEDIGNYYGYGQAVEVFGPDKQELLNHITDTNDIRIELVNIQYSDFNPIIYNSFCNYQDLHSIPEFNDEANKINNKGLEYEKAGDLDFAALCFSEAIILNPVYTNAYSNRGNVYNKMGDDLIEYVLADFNTALLLNPKHENTLFNRGMLFLKKHQFEKAIIDFTALLNINHGDYEAYTRRGLCYFNLKRADIALENYNRAIEINTRFAEAYYNRSVVYKFLGDNEKAQDDFSKAMLLDPELFLKNGQMFFIHSSK